MIGWLFGIFLGGAVKKREKKYISNVGTRKYKWKITVMYAQKTVNTKKN